MIWTKGLCCGELEPSALGLYIFRPEKSSDLDYSVRLDPWLPIAPTRRRLKFSTIFIKLDSSKLRYNLMT